MRTEKTPVGFKVQHLQLNCELGKKFSELVEKLPQNVFENDFELALFISQFVVAVAVVVVAAVFQPVC